MGSQLFCKDIVMIVLDSKLTLGRAGARSAGRGAGLRRSRRGLRAQSAVKSEASGMPAEQAV